jgi:hypothetical protein
MERGDRLEQPAGDRIIRRSTTEGLASEPSMEAAT